MLVSVRIDPLGRLRNLDMGMMKKGLDIRLAGLRVGSLAFGKEL